jgi:hypothetical protein
MLILDHMSSEIINGPGAPDPGALSESKITASTGREMSEFRFTLGGIFSIDLAGGIQPTRFKNPNFSNVAFWEGRWDGFNICWRSARVELKLSQANTIEYWLNHSAAHFCMFLIYSITWRPFWWLAVRAPKLSSHFQRPISLSLIEISRTCASSQRWKNLKAFRDGNQMVKRSLIARRSLTPVANYFLRIQFSSPGPLTCFWWRLRGR